MEAIDAAWVALPVTDRSFHRLALVRHLAELSGPAVASSLASAGGRPRNGSKLLLLLLLLLRSLSLPCPRTQFLIL